MTLEGCKSVCGPNGSLWPLPQQLKLAQNLKSIRIDPKIPVEIKGPDSIKPFIQGAMDIFREYLNKLTKEPKVDAKLKPLNVRFLIV